jgi:hypothetical protein
MRGLNRPHCAEPQNSADHNHDTGVRVIANLQSDGVLARAPAYSAPRVGAQEPFDRRMPVQRCNFSPAFFEVEALTTQIDG